MASSKALICNMALSHLLVGKSISDIETDKGQEAKACRLFYDTARDEMLRDFPWHFATKIVTLALVETEPNDEWSYSYQYPSDCLFFRRVLSGMRTDNRQSVVPFRIIEADDDSRSILLTDKPDAQAEYTKRAIDPTRYPPDFVIALSYRLAAYIAPRLTRRDQTKIVQRVTQFFDMSVRKAKASCAQEQQRDEMPEAESVRARY